MANLDETHDADLPAAIDRVTVSTPYSTEQRPINTNRVAIVPADKAPPSCRIQLEDERFEAVTREVPIDTMQQLVERGRAPTKEFEP